MTKLEICGVELWECSKSEANALWNDQPSERRRLWTEDEVTAHMSSGPAEILAAIATKTARPGKLANIPVSAPTSPLSSAAWCEGSEVLCSEVANCSGTCASP